MKQMKTTIAVALAACVGTQVFAANKQDIITLSLTSSHQSSVSTSSSANNVGAWSQGPKFYKTTSTKVTDQNVIQFIGYVLHHNANFYSTKAKLVLVQGELSGFFNITPDLGLDSWANYSSGILDGSFTSDDTDSSTAIANSTDSAFVTLDNGHHFLQTNPNVPGADFPVGHLQPWGQIFIQDSGKSASVLICENVTYFFAMTVEECYDCFYMNSFISTASFKVNTTSSPLPCCGNPSTLTGNGKDTYYMTLSFDNTENNPYLYYNSSCYVGVDGIGKDSTPASPIPGDGIVPDKINNPAYGTGYHDSIVFLIGKNLPYEARFTLNGLMTYTWNLKFVNNSDIAPDFVGTGNYACNGYGFIGLYCSLLTGTGKFTETIVNSSCCLNTPWYDNTVLGNLGGGWYGVGAEYVSGTDGGYETAYVSDYNGDGDASGYYLTPMNVSTSLSFHQNFDKANYGWNQAQADGYGTFPSGWDSEFPNNGVVTPLFY
jgi:hypothetical protein